MKLKPVSDNQDGQAYGVLPQGRPGLVERLHQADHEDSKWKHKNLPPEPTKTDAEIRISVCGAKNPDRWVRWGS